MSPIDEKDLLIRELRERSAEIDAHPIGLDTVRRSARRIQRRRRVVAGTVAAAVATVALPAGLAVAPRLASAPSDPVQQPTAPASPTPAEPTPTEPAPRPDGPVTLTLEGIEEGPAPRLTYRTPDGLVTPDGVLPTDRGLKAWERRGEGWIALETAREGAKVLTLDENLDVDSSETSGMTMAASADGSRVVYVRIEPDYSQTLLSTTALDAMTWTFPARSGVEPVGYAGPGEVVYVLRQGEASEAGIAYGDGQTRPLEGFVAVDDASEAAGLIAGVTQVDDSGSCSAVMDPAESTTAMVKRTCDYSLFSFSPDGRHLIASDPYQSGMGMTSLTVLDARTLEPVVEYEQPRGAQLALTTAAWESDETLLAVAVEGSTTTMLRLGLDGRLEQVVEPVEGDPFGDLPLWLSHTDW